jgi:5-bromo-4-chloroindolyl phosphate hydrolysis protein
MMNDQPNFSAWSNENLAKFASDSYAQMQNQQERIEELQRCLKEVAEIMKDLRKTIGPWND